VDAFRAAFEQHLVCNHILATQFIPGMKEAGYGRIINVISTSVKQPLHNLGVSNTIRGAVANWAKTLANELGGHGITVNNVLPGATSTGRLEGIIRNKAGRTQQDEASCGRRNAGRNPCTAFWPARGNCLRDCLPCQPLGGLYQWHQPARGWGKNCLIVM
jgi:3-oxoacyl-[acyl-carrier protein] reductase